MHKEKSRDQSLYNYLESLQLEYITCELRKRIYLKKKDRSFYQRTMDYKKTKIADIAERNFLPTIFNDDKVKASMYAKVYKEHGYPEFVYNSTSDREEFVDKDRDNYFSIDAEVRVLMSESTVEIGIIMDRFFEKEIVYVKLREHAETSPFPISRVTRIL